MIDVGKMIASIRKERRLSQAQLADRLGLSKQAVSNYERGIREPDYVTLEAIADVLNVPMSMLISREEQKAALDALYAAPPIPSNVLPISALRSGADPKTVQHNLGHSSAAMTLDVYAAYTTDAATEAARKLSAYWQDATK